MAGHRVGYLFLSLFLLCSVGCGENDKGSGDPGPGAGGSGGEGGSGGVEGSGKGRLGCGPSEGEAPGPDLRLAALEGEAEACVDRKGLLHLRCENDADCMRLLGYFHSRSRFFQMDVQRRAARGKLHTLAPLPELGEADVQLRLLLSTSSGQPIEDAIWDEADETSRLVLEAYSEGVNAWLEDLRAGRNNAKLSEEARFPLTISASNIPAWEPKDSVAIARLIAMLLSDSSEREIAYGRAFTRLAEISPELALDLLTLKPGAKSYTLPPEAAPQALRAAGAEAEAASALAGQLAPAGALFDQALERAAQLRQTPIQLPRISGSNNWVVAPARTQAGKALLANDPHLELSNPPMFFLVHLDASAGGGLHVAGATFPGAPAVVIGNNEKVAWGSTVAFYDVSDVYVEELAADGKAVRFQGEDVTLIRKDFTVDGGLLGGGKRTYTLEWVPHHGPVIAKDAAAGKALSLRWTGQVPSDELGAYLGLAKAQNVEEAAGALERFRVGAQNFVLADVSGDIAWVAPAAVPKRSWASFEEEPALAPWMPLPGDGSAEWEGMLPVEELPSLFNPTSGLIATANQDLTGATESGDPTATGKPMLQNLVDPGLRHQRIMEELEAGGSRHDRASMERLQLDDHSLLGEWFVPHLLAAADENPLNPQGAALLGALRGWEFRCPTGLQGHEPEGPASENAEEVAEAAGCMAFHYALRALVEESLGEKLVAVEAPWDAHLILRPLILALERPEELRSGSQIWDRLDGSPRSQEEVLIAALEKGGAALAEDWGAEPAQWLWGRAHTVSLLSPLSIAASIFGNLSLGPYAAPGGLFTVNVANPSLLPGRGYGFGQGASLRLVAELSEEGVVTTLQLPGGQDQHRSSPYHDNLVEGWLEGESFPLPFDREAVLATEGERWIVAP